jgi:hypothetical protein
LGTTTGLEGTYTGVFIKKKKKIKGKIISLCYIEQRIRVGTYNRLTKKTGRES